MENQDAPAGGGADALMPPDLQKSHSIWRKITVPAKLGGLRHHFRMRGMTAAV